MSEIHELTEKAVRDAHHHLIVAEEVLALAKDLSTMVYVRRIAIAYESWAREIDKRIPTRQSDIPLHLQANLLKFQAERMIFKADQAQREGATNHG